MTSEPKLFSRYSSKIKRINIPLFNYCNENDNTHEIGTDTSSVYIERKRLKSQLMKWLDDNNNRGAYLVTGFRGMGKTVFVKRIVNQIKIKNPKDMPTSKVLYLYLLPAVLFFFIFVVHIVRDDIVNPNVILLVFLAYIIFNMIIALLSIHGWKSKPESYVLPIDINVGNEIRNERDILATIANIVNDVFKRHERSLWRGKSSFGPDALMYYVLIICITLFHYFGVGFLENIQLVLTAFCESAKTSFVSSVMMAVVKIMQVIRDSLCLRVLTDICVGYLTVRLLLYPLVLMALRCISLEHVCDRRSALRQLNELIEHITYSTNESIQVSSGANNTSWLFRSQRSRERPPMSVREIEYGLSKVINDISSSLFLHTKFIIVFDELDKIDLSTSQSKDVLDSDSLSKSVLPTLSADELISSDNVTIREKQRRLISLLGQLKFFISTTQAKFVFIAGHELYDAYLADVSDREFSVSSIFNGIINLPSFLSTDSRFKSVTKMTEAFVCKSLFPICEDENTVDDLNEYTLENLSKKYLQHVGEVTLSDNKKVVNETDDSLKEYLILVLFQFITYLTFASNGAPKKVVSMFNKYVELIDKHTEKDDTADEVIELRPREGCHFNVSAYLSLGFKDLEKIGFIHYIAKPIFANILDKDSDYDDRLLVTSLFLISHIYKHSHSGFSWRDLEYIPELTESSHSPELRKYVKKIFSDMESMALTTMTSGIYSYKFSKNLSEEISYFSRKYEDVSAIFYFSPDYFKSVKTYFYNLLPFYEKKGDAASSIIASIHFYLGDIHLAEEDYNQAINQYRISAELQRQLLACSPQKHLPMLVVRYAHSMLKLGLAYEKRNNCDYAFLIYNTLTDVLVDFRDVDPSILGLESSLIFDRESGRDRTDFIFHENRCSFFPKSSRYLPDIISKDKTDGYKMWSYGGEMMNNLCSYLSPVKKEIISKLTVFEDLRIVYLSILAKLFSIEKYNVCGITSSNIQLAVSEFEYMYKMTNVSSKYLLEVDFYRKFGDILYYKNHNFYSKNSWNDIFMTWSIDLKRITTNFLFNQHISKKNFEAILKKLDDLPMTTLACVFVCKWDRLKSEISEMMANAGVKDDSNYFEKIDSALIRCRNRVNEVEGDGKEDIKKQLEIMFSCYEKNRHCTDYHKGIPLPCSACSFYHKSFTVFINNKLTSGERKVKSNVLFFLCEMTKPGSQTFHFNELLHAALTLSSLGDVMLSCSFSDQKLDLSLVSNSLEAINNNGHIGCSDDSDLTNLTRSVLYYLAALLCYERLGKYKDTCECMLRIIRISTRYLRNFPCNDDERKKYLIFVSKVEDCMFRIIKMLYSARGYSCMPEIQRFKYVFDNKMERHVLMGLTSVMPDIEDLVFSYYELLMTDSNVSVGLISYLYQAPSLKNRRYSSMSYNRLISLRFKERLNYYVYNKCFINENKGDKGDKGFRDALIKTFCHDKSDNSFEDFLIKDSVFCLRSILSALDTVPNRTIFTYSYIGDVYGNMTFWIEEDEKSGRNLIKNTEYMLKVTFMKENKERFYHKAVRLNTEGREYHQMIENFYILDDDLQNDTAHFYIAYERYKLRCKECEERPLTSIDGIRGAEKGHSYYKPSSYVGHHIKREKGKRILQVGDHIPYSKLKPINHSKDEDLSTFMFNKPFCMCSGKIPSGWNDCYGILESEIDIKRVCECLSLSQGCLYKQTSESKYYIDVGIDKHLYYGLGGKIDSGVVYKFDVFGYVTEVIDTESSKCRMDCQGVSCTAIPED